VAEGVQPHIAVRHTVVALVHDHGQVTLNDILQTTKHFKLHALHIDLYERSLLGLEEEPERYDDHVLGNWLPF